MLQALDEGAPWKSGEVILFGKAVLQPRLFCYMADDPSLGFTYSGAPMVVEPWHPVALQLKVCKHCHAMQCCGPNAQQRKRLIACSAPVLRGGAEKTVQM